MPVNCTQCGAPLKKGQRFCVKCGAPVSAPPEEQPKLDLSAYFDEPPAEPGAPLPEQPDWAPTEPVQVEWASEPEPRKSEKGLNVALMICGVLAVAVITFVLILLLWPSDNGTPAPAPTEGPVLVSAAPESEPPAATDAPFIIVTPSPAPAPTPAPTPLPTIAATTPPPTIPPSSASDYLLPDSDSRYLTEADLKDLTHEQLCLARNEIFARHGRIFKTPQIAAYFNTKSWYSGTVSAENFKESVFNQYERANVSFISEYEQKYYGGSYY